MAVINKGRGSCGAKTVNSTKKLIVSIKSKHARLWSLMSGVCAFRITTSSCRGHYAMCVLIKFIPFLRSAHSLRCTKKHHQPVFIFSFHSTSLSHLFTSEISLFHLLKLHCVLRFNVIFTKE